jgi:hypothetical protein
LKELPTSLKIIGDSVFAYQSTLYTNTTNWKNHIVSFGSYSFMWTKLVSGAEVVEFSGSITTINQQAFAGTNIQNVKIGSSIKSIGYQAFLSSGSSISPIKTVDITEIDTSIDFGSGIFSQCYYLQLIKLPDEFVVEYIFNLFSDDDNTVYYGWKGHGSATDSHKFKISNATPTTSQTNLLASVNSYLQSKSVNRTWEFVTTS